MKKLALILGSAVLFSQGAMAETSDARGGFDREQVKYERQAKIERDKKYHYARLSREDEKFN
ncbi:hypothetical protein J3998_08110 [Thiomicrorhabdus sp. 6S2-11]|jgi:hypothetical protein|uniref:Uncharacterized protein n=1 Tax=Thiomicrorhabdus marina TaxID=2818442 RepID=A0ABS3Q5I1_9GAMM|nr:hypothetical protein [Thiomicrorhabdus marina]MBO1927541.1 hypothetical protein [Thiomicrorhabdus marina]